MPRKTPSPIPPQPNPQTLRDELLEYIEQEELGLFRCDALSIPIEDSLWWDVKQNPNYREFFQAAKATGAKLMYFFEQVFSEADIERVEDGLEIAVLPEDEHRMVRRRLADFRGYLGFLCRVGVGFQHEGRIHWFDVYAPWFFEYLDLVEDVEIMSGMGPGMGEDEDEEEPPMGGYYSRN